VLGTCRRQHAFGTAEADPLAKTSEKRTMAFSQLETGGVRRWTASNNADDKAGNRRLRICQSQKSGITRLSLSTDKSPAFWPQVALPTQKGLIFIHRSISLHV
jgi:hypothetical protein